VKVSAHNRPVRVSTHTTLVTCVSSLPMDETVWVHIISKYELTINTLVHKKH